jgi:hypothetical protein
MLRILAASLIIGEPIFDVTCLSIESKYDLFAIAGISLFYGLVQSIFEL